MYVIYVIWARAWGPGASVAILAQGIWAQAIQGTRFVIVFPLSPFPQVPSPADRVTESAVRLKPRRLEQRALLGTESSDNAVNLTAGDYKSKQPGAV